jgi:hypothetical protein
MAVQRCCSIKRNLDKTEIFHCQEPGVKGSRSGVWFVPSAVCCVSPTVLDLFLRCGFSPRHRPPYSSLAICLPSWRLAVTNCLPAGSIFAGGALNFLPVGNRVSVHGSTPSPGPPPLVKARVAVHPLPQRGRGLRSWVVRFEHLQTPVHKFHPWLMAFGPEAATLPRL